MALIQTACTYDCPDACALLVQVEGGRLSIRGDPGHPITRGFVCRRVRRHPLRLSDPERITSPRLRRGGGFEEIDWDQALDLAAGQLRRALDEHGPAAVVHLGGGGSLGIKKLLVGHFFHSLGPVTTPRGGVCDEAGKQAQVLDFGDCCSHDYTDLRHSRAVVLWGKDPMETSPHLVPFLREARACGAPVVLIDVRPTRSGVLADRFIGLSPGGDGRLALAALRRLWQRGRLDPEAIGRCDNFSRFERMLAALDTDDLCRGAGVDPAAAEYLADLYAGSRPVATWVGFGLQRRRWGGGNIRRIDALGALSGNVGLAGGGVNFGPGRLRGLDLSMLAPRTGRGIRAAFFGRDLEALADPPARFVYINGANPVCQFADSRAAGAALRRAGFVVVADAFFTDTAECADLILPTTLMLEEGQDLVGSFGHHHLARVRRAVDPPPGVREDVWIVKELNRRLGRPEDPLLAEPGAAVRRMAAGCFADAQEPHRRNPAQEAMPFSRGYQTSSGRMRLICEPPQGTSEEDGYPLTLLSPKSYRYQHSQIPPGEQQGPPFCRLHPRAPGAEGLRPGDLARLESPLGGMIVRLRPDAGLRRDVCVVTQGGWLRLGRGVNALVREGETDLGGCTAFYDQRVRIEPLAP